MFKKGQIKKVLRWNGDYVWIEKRDDKYIPYESHMKSLLGIAAPSLIARYDQETLKQAFESGFLNY